MTTFAIWFVSLLCLYLAGLGSACHALVSGRNQQSSLAWGLLLVVVPFLSLPLYWLVGRSRLGGYVQHRRNLLDETDDVRQRVCHELKSSRVDSEPFPFAERLTRLVPTGGNEIKRFDDNESAFRAVIQTIENAREYVLVQFYVVRDDRAGQTLVSALCTLADKGVPVHFFYDPLESRISEQKEQSLRECGVRLALHTPGSAGWDPIKGNFRNHRKLVVIDGTTAFLGGMNVGDNYLSRLDHLSPWNDTFLRLRGPAVLNTQLAFYRDYLFSTEEELDLNWRVAEPHAGEAEVAVFPTDPADIWDSCGLAFVEAVNRARKRIILASPYFLPDEKGLAALQTALLRGVRVQILRPHRTLVKTADLAAWHYIRALLPHGAEFYRQPEGVMHQKLLLVDDDMVLVGSANFDYRSFHLNHEIFLWAKGPNVTKQFEKSLTEDRGRFQKITVEDVEQRSITQRVLTEATSLLSPLL